MIHCDYLGCEREGVECHAGEVYLCAEHYAAASEAQQDVDAWLDVLESDRC